MTEDQARVILLENALHGAASTIGFLHGCLTNPVFKYTYPDHTETTLSEIEDLVGQREYCVHSFFSEGCSSCEDRVDNWNKTAKAREVLDGSTP